MYLTDEQLETSREDYRRYVEVEYSLPGEINNSIVSLRPSWNPDALQDPVNIGEGLFAERSSFHGKGPIITHGIQE